MKRLMALLFLSLCLGACQRTAQPPFNEYRSTQHKMRRPLTDAGVGTAIGVMAAATPIGAAAGGLIGITRQRYRDTTPAVLAAELSKYSIQVIDDHDVYTIIVPTDKYFYHHRPKINELAYPGLNRLADLLYIKGLKGDIYIAAFTDNVGTKDYREKRSEGLAQAMAAFLMAKGFDPKQLHPAGHASHFAIANNHLIHGAAMNRRVEVQWRKR